MSIFEHGSAFHFIALNSKYDQRPEYFKTASFWGSGRDALLALVLTGKWRRIWLPSYYCQNVVSALQKLEIEIAFYPDSPLWQIPEMTQNEFSQDELLLVVNYFGLRQHSHVKGVTLVEDHSHDLGSVWACESKADYCFASLRKTLPLPDGGVLWSPIGHEIAPEIEITREHSMAVRQKLAAMILKSKYLLGVSNSKNLFRRLENLGEELIGAGPVSGISDYSRKSLEFFPLQQWRLMRYENFKAAYVILSRYPKIQVLYPEDGCIPFSVIVLFENKKDRDLVKQKLIESNIYPAILWPDNKGDLSERLLSLHCDWRYSPLDMEVVAHKLIELL